MNLQAIENEFLAKEIKEDCEWAIDFAKSNMESGFITKGQFNSFVSRREAQACEQLLKLNQNIQNQ